MNIRLEKEREERERTEQERQEREQREREEAERQRQTEIRVQELINRQRQRACEANPRSVHCGGGDQNPDEVDN